MIVPDVNLLLYAYDAGSQYHGPAAKWWRRCLEGDEAVGLVPAAVFGFVRVGTSAKVFVEPMTVAEAGAHVRSWLARPMVQVLEPGDGEIERVLTLLETLGTGGNLVTDAQLAAAAIHHEAILHTADADFARFNGLRWRNPL